MNKYSGFPIQEQKLSKNQLEMFQNSVRESRWSEDTGRHLLCIGTVTVFCDSISPCGLKDPGNYLHHDNKRRKETETENIQRLLTVLESKWYITLVNFLLKGQDQYGRQGDTFLLSGARVKKISSVVSSKSLLHLLSHFTASS